MEYVVIIYVETFSFFYLLLYDNRANERLYTSFIYTIKMFCYCPQLIISNFYYYARKETDKKMLLNYYKTESTRIRMS